MEETKPRMYDIQDKMENSLVAAFAEALKFPDGSEQQLAMLREIADYAKDKGGFTYPELDELLFKAM